MAKSTNRRNEAAAPSPFEQARDEMFQHILRCGVIQAAPEHQAEWFEDTIDYLADRYHELSESELTELRTLGTRFCEPPRARTTQDSSADAA